jgi:hypothetical protein
MRQHAFIPPSKGVETVGDIPPLGQIVSVAATTVKQGFRVGQTNPFDFAFVAARPTGERIHLVLNLGQIRKAAESTRKFVPRCKLPLSMFHRDRRGAQRAGDFVMIGYEDGLADYCSNAVSYGPIVGRAAAIDGLPILRRPTTQLR